MKYIYTLPDLPYAFDALEPYIDAKTMQVHHDGHHKAYVDNLNKALESYPDLQQKTLDDLLINLDTIPAEVRTAIRNNGGGNYNHTMFWTLMKKKGGGQPKGETAKAIQGVFNTFENFQEKFNAAAKTVFGSGWAWLCVNKNGKLEITSTPNQDCPITFGLKPILGLDVWEHAYYLKYQNKRPDYINAWWNVINWDQVEENYREAIR